MPSCGYGRRRVSSQLRHGHFPAGRMLVAHLHRREGVSGMEDGQTKCGNETHAAVNISDLASGPWLIWSGSTHTPSNAINSASFCMISFRHPPAISAIRYTQRIKMTVYAVRSEPTNNLNRMLETRLTTDWLHSLRR